MPLPQPLPSPPPLSSSSPWRLPRLAPFRATLWPHHHPILPRPSSAIRHFSSTTAQRGQRASFFERSRKALRDTRIEWYAIPVGLGIGVVALVHLRNAHSRQQKRQEPAIRPMNSWQVQVLSTLPLKAMSYYWGKFNEIPLPRFLRVPGFKLYAYIFGVNLDEVEKDLREYRNLSEFFYRRLKEGVRVADERSEVVVSPADGAVLQVGEVMRGGRVEQVKGMSYSLDALLGAQHAVSSTEGNGGAGNGGDVDIARVTSDEEFANVNGISYTLPSLLLSGDSNTTAPQQQQQEERDASIQPSDTAAVTSVGVDLTKGAISTWWTGDVSTRKKSLYFAVIYLAPGDYHRFHSPVNWVVERRRHFAGELFSVSPYLQDRLPGLFTLNERVVLLGRWRYGMFSMTPVGATNVGSIKIHFDRELRTNSLTHNATNAGDKGVPFAEATYKGSSALLGGHPVVKGSEMGGFNLGSTVVLVFEAPGPGEGGKGGFRFLVRRGQKIKVGEALGIVEV